MTYQELNGKIMHLSFTTYKMWSACIQINSAGIRSGPTTVQTHSGMRDRMTYQELNRKHNAPMFYILNCQYNLLIYFIRCGVLAYCSRLLKSAMVTQLYKPTVDCKTG